ncbi:MAG: hypothetical protein KAS77_09340 [Thermoplasmata archaeon]|nr:hypothetical protein [Thermoplasmata archaeon]
MSGTRGWEADVDAAQSATKVLRRLATTSTPSRTSTTSRFLAAEDQAQLREPMMATRPSMIAPLAWTRATPGIPSATAAVT